MAANRCDGLPRDGVLRSLDRQIDALVYDLYALNHVMVGTPLEDFEYLDDEEPEMLPDPAALI